MKARILPLITFFVSYSLYAAQAHQDIELHLHWDVNKTIIAMDAVQDKELEETVNGVLAEFTFEKWDGLKQQSYYSFLTDRIARENPELSRADETFKRKRAELLRAFPDYLKSHKELLAKYLDEKSRMLQILNKDTMVIFPSFFKCIAWLEREYPHKYAMYLRTFGTDLPEVVPAIERQSSLKFAGVGHFSGRTVNMGQKAHSLHDFFKNPGLAHYAIRDDYAFWKSHGFQSSGGKPFIVHSQDKRRISVFLDDNADDVDKPIVCPLASDNTVLPVSELLQKGLIVAVNPKEAILDEDYFINKIKPLLVASQK